MTRPSALSSWEATLSTYLPHLSRPQRAVLALWSFGIVLAQSCGLTTVAVMLAYLLDGREASMRVRLREWYREATAKAGSKRGDKRRTRDLTACFPALLRWVVAWWDPTCPRM